MISQYSPIMKTRRLLLAALLSGTLSTVHAQSLPETWTAFILDRSFKQSQRTTQEAFLKAGLDSIPAAIEIDGSVLAPRQVVRSGTVFDFTPMLDYPHYSCDSVLLMTEIQSPASTSIRIGSGADWTMTWLVNGEVVFSSMKTGNQAKPPSATDYVFELPLEAGSNTLAVILHSGVDAAKLHMADEGRLFELRRTTLKQPTIPSGHRLVQARVHPKLDPMIYLAETVENLRGFDTEGAVDSTDSFGGSAERPADIGPGKYFRTTFQNGRWWMVTPEGNLYIDRSVNAVAMTGGPAAEKAFDERFETPERWANSVSRFLREYGLSSAGSWSNIEVLQHAEPKLPYYIQLNVDRAFARSLGEEAGNEARPVNVYHPEYAAFAREQIETEMGLVDLSDPYLIGYFSDNELNWKSVDLAKLLADPDSRPYAAAAAKAFMKDRYGSEPPSVPSATDRSVWRQRVAERYYGLMASILEELDPNRLYVGSRLHWENKYDPALLEACGRYCDVISLNWYGDWVPDAEKLNEIYAIAGKPLMITEFYTKGEDSGMANTSGAGWVVPPQEDRGLAYESYTLECLRHPALVGWHWFMYRDNDPDDPNASRSNVDSNKGLVDRLYEPYPDMLDNMARVNRRVYSLLEYFGY